MEAIINLCNNASINVINDFINNLEIEIGISSETFEKQITDAASNKTDADTIINLFKINTNKNILH